MMSQDINQIIYVNFSGNLLQYHGHLYKKNKSNPNKDYYRCMDEQCLAKIHTRHNSTIVIFDNHMRHGHALPNDVTLKSELLETAKQAVDDDPTICMPKLWEDVCGAHERRHPNAGHRYPEFSEVKSTLYRYRSNALPPIPDEIDDVDFNQIPAVWSTTSRGTRFMRKHDINFGITLFCTNEQLDLLSETRFLVADGTFKTAPDPYRQVYTFHGIIGGRRIPLVFALMEQRTTAHYIRLLELISRYVLRVTATVWDPQLIVTDYEIGFMNARIQCLPNCVHRGCLFHIDKAIFKKVKRYGLERAYRNNDDIKAYIRKIMALPFLPVLLLRNSYNLLKRRCRRLIRRNPRLARLNRYFERTWLNGGFPIPLWNCFNRPVRLRTTNAVEGWNFRWNRRVGLTHPNLWFFIIALKKEEAVVHRSIRQFRRNQPPPQQRRNYRRLNRVIQSLRDDYQNNAITLDGYWDAITYACHNF